MILTEFVESINPTYVTDKTNKRLKELQCSGNEIVNVMPFFSATYSEDKKASKRIGAMILYDNKEATDEKVI